MLKPELHDSTNFSEMTAWQLAEKHTFVATTLQIMEEVLAEMMGDTLDSVMEDMYL